MLIEQSRALGVILGGVGGLLGRRGTPCTRQAYHTPKYTQARDAFYVDGDPAEARLLLAPVSAMVARLQQLLGLFPEQPILEQLLAISRRLLALPLHSPLGRLLTGVELLHRKGLEWEVHTHTQSIVPAACRTHVP